MGGEGIEITCMWRQADWNGMDCYGKKGRHMCMWRVACGHKTHNETASHNNNKYNIYSGYELEAEWEAEQKRKRARCVYYYPFYCSSIFIGLSTKSVRWANGG